MKYSFIILTIISLLYSCNDNEEPYIPATQRTILIYMVANNSLGIAGLDEIDIQEMINASNNSSFNNGRLIIYHAPHNQSPSLIEISNGSILTHKVYDQSISSVSSKRMQQVFTDVKTIAPAKDYGLVLWSHANGWRETGIETSINTNQKSSTLAFGDDKGKHMNITTLASILNEENFSFIYFDCCFMATIESAYELRNATSHIIASTTEVPGTGMPYEQNLPLLFANPTKLKEACMTTFDYYNSQKGQSRSCAISLIETKYLNELANITTEIYKQQPLLPTNFEPQKYALDSICYYFDFGQYIDALSINYPYLNSLWQSSLNKTIPYKAATPYMWNSLKIKHHSGLSTYILNSYDDRTNNEYNNLQWWNDVAINLWTTNNYK